MVFNSFVVTGSVINILHVLNSGSIAFVIRKQRSLEYDSSPPVLRLYCLCLLQP